MNPKLTIFASLATFLALSACSPTPAESTRATRKASPIGNGSAVEKWRWTDEAKVKQSFEKAILDDLPKNCKKADDLFGYQSVYYAAGRKEVAYEMVLRLDKDCFEKLRSQLTVDASAQKLNFGGRKVRKIEPHFKADGGPTLIFYFSATPADLADLKKLEE